MVAAESGASAPLASLHDWPERTMTVRGRWRADGGRSRIDGMAPDCVSSAGGVGSGLSGLVMGAAVRGGTEGTGGKAERDGGGGGSDGASGFAGALSGTGALSPGRPPMAPPTGVRLIIDCRLRATGGGRPVPMADTGKTNGEAKGNIPKEQSNLFTARRR
jgi:hypothetical protein